MKKRINMQTINKGGRPKKEGRKKIGLSVDGKTFNLLEKLANETGKTKSRLFEEAIAELDKREEMIKERMKIILNEGKDAFLDCDEVMKNADAIDKEQGVNNVKTAG